MELENSKLLDCHECHRKFDQFELELHYLSHEDQKPSLQKLTNDKKCDICEKVFTHEYVKRNHIEIVHKRIKSLKCKICDKPFGCKSSLTQHCSSVHQLEEKHKCDICEQTFSLKSKHTHHMKINHSERRNAGYNICSQCGKSLSTKRNLYVH